jgi:hypothetical protein
VICRAFTSLQERWISVVGDMEKNHHVTCRGAGVLLLLTQFPFSLFLSVVVACLPLPDLFGQVMGMISQGVPASSMGPRTDSTKDPQP